MAEVELLVRYFAGAAAAAGTDEEVVQIAVGATAEDLLAVLAGRHPRLVPVLEVASLLADELVVRDRTAALATTAGRRLQVDVLPPFAGG
ncbi:Molybdopterin converting factor, small subunit [Quadrisphaera granulorum]|uniref:Molybdopterin converting factor small subunit n=1 Tax=Quadrisphaera granulorum TaxID=317664 RepID=A0A315ZUK5_9ACTN|nr:MoaD/ThiS family protein [Quadrisphaera granulorum]PWJ49012.1 molybdopterin converting factor small subunit [Quadrisphaera granulorum]SZE98222.1 Molybdopterin converting factor, small subunit [Quadrisphaera granulorum]